MTPLICIHGAIGNAAQMQPLADALAHDRQVYNLELPGHGASPWPSGGLNFGSFDRAILDFMDQEHIEQADFLGYSMGGYAVAHMGLQHAARVRRLMTLGTRWLWNADVAARETAFLDPGKIRLKVPAFAALLEQRHPQGWEKLLQATATLLSDMGQNPALHPENIRQLPFPVQICLGDRDATAGLEESLSVFRLLPEARLSVMASTDHPIEKMNLAEVADLSTRFFA